MTSTVISNSCASAIVVDGVSVGSEAKTITSPSKVTIAFGLVTLVLTYIYPSIFSDNVDIVKVNINPQAINIIFNTNGVDVASIDANWAAVYTGDDGTNINYNINIPF